MALASNDNPYWVHSSVEILYTLNELRKTRISLGCESGQSGEVFTTEILAADAKDGLVIDVPPLQSQLDRALKSGTVTLRTATAGIKIEFELDTLSTTQWQGGSALRAPLPKRILKIQRRNFFRVAIPKSRPLACVIAQPGGKTFAYTVLDIGLGGAALFCKETDPALEEGKTYEKCRIALPEMGTLELRLQVRHVAIISVENRPSSRRYGCEFADLKGPQEALIQRFVLQLERDRRAADLVDS